MSLLRAISTLLLASALVLGACGDEEGGAGDTGNDVRPVGDTGDAGDVTADGADVAPDAPADVTPDPDVTADPDLPAPDDTFEVIIPDATGVDCSEDANLCEGEYTCVEGVCTLDPTGRAWVEQSYRIREPEELEHVFDFIKTFAADVAFFMIEVSATEGEPDRRPARYGTADRITLPETGDVVYAWQFETIDRLILEPARGESGLEGNVWESNVFQWNLEAHIVLEDLRVDEIIGFVAELTQVRFELDDDMRSGEGVFTGVVTRREAETRYFDPTAFEPFRAIICRVHPNLVPPGERWSLADILDCNAAPMDVDLNGDGVLDGYRTIVDFLVEPATIVPRPE